MKIVGYSKKCSIILSTELSANLVESHVASQQHAVITYVEVYAGSVEICK